MSVGDAVDASGLFFLQYRVPDNNNSNEAKGKSNCKAKSRAGKTDSTTTMDEALGK